MKYVYSAIKGIIGLIVTAVLVGQTSSVIARPLPLPRVEADRITQLNRFGGLVTSATRLPDGTLWAAEGSALVQLIPSGEVLSPIARVDLGHGAILHMQNQGDYLYVLTEEGVLVVSAANANVIQVMQIAPGSGSTFSQVGRRLVVAAGEAGLRFYTIQTNQHLQYVADLDLGSTITDVTLTSTGRRVYASQQSGGIYAVSWQDADAPTLDGQLPETNDLTYLTLSEPLLVAAGPDRLAVLDPTNGTRPLLGEYAPLKNAQRVAADAEFIYVADDIDGVKIFWRVDPDRPIQVYGDIGIGARDLQLVDNLLYVVGPSGLRILDISSRYRPLEISRLALPGDPQALDVTDGRVFVALGQMGVGVINTSNLAEPRLERRIPINDEARDLVFSGGSIFVAANEAGLAVIDPAAARDETLRGNYALTGQAQALALQDGVLYIAAGTGGLLSLDVSQPEQPTLLAIRPAAANRPILSVSVSGRRATIAEGISAAILDIEARTTLSLLARMDVTAQDTIPIDEELITVGGNRFAVWDISAMAQPRRLADYAGWRDPTGVVTDTDGQVYVSGGAGGPALFALELTAPDYPVERGSSALQGTAYPPVITNSLMLLPVGFGGLRTVSVSEGGIINDGAGYASLAAMQATATEGDRMVVGGRNGWLWLDVSGAALRVIQSGDDSITAVAMQQNRVVLATDEQLLLYQVDDDDQLAFVSSRDLTQPVISLHILPDAVITGSVDGLDWYDGDFLSPAWQTRTADRVTDIQPLDDSTLLITTQDGTISRLRLPATSITESIEGTTLTTSRPNQLVQDPANGAIYALDDSGRVSRLDVDSLGNLYAAADVRINHFALDGLWANELVWLPTVDEGLVRYDIRFLTTNGARMIGRIPIQVDAFAVKSRVVFTGSEDGLAWLDRGNVGLVTSLLDDPISALLIEGNRLYAAGQSLSVLDVTNPTVPILLGSYPLNGSARHITIVDERVAVSTAQGVTVFYQVENQALVQVAQIGSGTPIEQSAWVDDQLFMARADGGLQWIDLTDNESPQQVMIITSGLGQRVVDMLPLPDQQLMVSYDAGITIYDLSDPTTNPVIEPIVSTGSTSLRGVATNANGDQLAVMRDEQTILLLSPTEHAYTTVAQITGKDRVESVSVSGDRLYAVEGQCGLRVYDISQPDAIHEIAYWRSGYGHDVHVLSDERLILSEANQLYTLRLNEFAPGSPPPAPQQPIPADGSDNHPADVMLQWEASADPCTPLTHEIYLGNDPDQLTLIGTSTDQAVTSISGLEPLQTYYWQVITTDGQGDTVTGPVWQFITAPADFPSDLPGAPAQFIQRIRQNPALLMLLLVAVAGLLGWRLLRRGLSSTDDESPLPPADWSIDD